MNLFSLLLLLQCCIEKTTKNKKSPRICAIIVEMNLFSVLLLFQCCIEKAKQPQKFLKWGAPRASRVAHPMCLKFVEFPEFVLLIISS